MVYWSKSIFWSNSFLMSWRDWFYLYDFFKSAKFFMFIKSKLWNFYSSWVSYLYSSWLFRYYSFSKTTFYSILLYSSVYICEPFIDYSRFFSSSFLIFSYISLSDLRSDSRYVSFSKIFCKSCVFLAFKT